MLVLASAIVTVCDRFRCVLLCTIVFDVPLLRERERSRILVQLYWYTKSGMKATGESSPADRAAAIACDLMDASCDMTT